MLQAHEVEQIIQQLRSEESDREVPYLGIFYSEHPDYWHINANRAGLHKYAADLLRASITPSTIEAGGSSTVGLNSVWLDEAGDAQPLFVRLADGPDPIPEEADNSSLDLPLQIGCWLAVIILAGIFLAGIKEITDLLRA